MCPCYPCYLVYVSEWQLQNRPHSVTAFCLRFRVPWHGKGLLIRPAKIYFTFQAAGTTEHWPQIVEEQIGRQRQDIGKTYKGRLQDNNCGGISG